jgi:hypothetical protein
MILATVSAVFEFIEFGQHKITSLLVGDFIVTQELRFKRTHRLTPVVYLGKKTPIHRVPKAFGNIPYPK